VRLMALVLMLVMFSGCAGTAAIQPTASSSDLIQLAADYRSALSRDEDLSRICTNFSFTYSGAILGTLEVNKKAFADVPRVQRYLIVHKAAVAYARQFAGSPARSLGVSAVTIKDDMGSTRGWIIVSTTGNVQYSLYGS
jgi:hypothetical protein